MLPLSEKLPVSFIKISDLTEISRLADELFIDHQSHCMQDQWPEAFHRLELLHLLRHYNMQIEEELLLPPYGYLRTQIPKGGALKYFLREHHLIKKYLDKITRMISQKVLEPAVQRINLVQLFEEYHGLKDLLDHHDSRDRVFLYRILDEQLDKPKRMAILEQMNQKQRDLIRRMDMEC